MIIPYPVDFITEINRLLGDQSSRFWDTQKTSHLRSGLRVNTLKTSLDYVKSILPPETTDVPWAKDGVQIPAGLNAGKHPYHSAGLYYLQEPSAMAPVAVLDPQPGELILDLCAAPGGKSTQILSLMRNNGVLIANDSNPRRVQALARNIERWGGLNSIVTNDVPKRLADQFGPIFDRILVDAPCSGEGTFRTNPTELKQWSLKFSKRCASIQDEILWFAGKLLRPGGVLVYSTCTFNQLENEGSVDRFLEASPDFRIDPILIQPGFQNGIPFSIQDPRGLKGTIRIWPHLAPGEGHFIARLKKAGSTLNQISLQSTPTGITNENQQIYEKFFNSTLKRTERTEVISPESSSLACFGNQLYLIHQNSPQLEGLKIHHWGWSLGKFSENRFLPSSALAFGLTKEDLQLVIELPLNDPNLLSYLRGSPFASPEIKVEDKGWVMVTVDGFSLGWGKKVQGRIKSHFPNWLKQG
ncbi:MAG: RsmB/NOP family class I SAM-dependent RNA methyltransferase [Anaerolineales bacterium]|nr:RsmB/NOP family class I SAM-dependent RNA methyltransferase [Anaerolineales bacterium]